MRLPLYPLPRLAYFFLGFAHILLGTNQDHREILVPYVYGNCFLQPLANTNLPPSPLTLNKQIDEVLPFAIGTSSDSFLEIDFRDEDKITKIRLGNASALEFLKLNHYQLHKGALLLFHEDTQTWNFHVSDSLIQILGSGTWMMERLSFGIKVILLEGKLTITNIGEKSILSNGDLVLVNQANPRGTNPIKVDLPLLLGTSRLINGFPSALPSKSRLFSAAQVQALRMKKKYDALVGDVTNEKKLQLWSVLQNK